MHDEEAVAAAVKQRTIKQCAATVRAFQLCNAFCGFCPSNQPCSWRVSDGCSSLSMTIEAIFTC